MVTTPPSQLTAGHLVQALLPDDRETEPVDTVAHYTQVLTRLDGQLSIAELWKGRFEILPVPPAPQTLQELVQVARRRLRDDRLRADTEELEARRWVVERVIEVIRL